ncbi:MAG TPA: tRNA lysidine(34) synthetase TilS [Chloroflexota bacterium]|nr:tRNA lysidine(34) synthetase TilS [Chloroflexota bacterium]
MNEALARLEAALRVAPLRPGARLLLAVSGGADSVALLRTTCNLAPEMEWDVRIGHVHHGLRGSEADRDESFVRHLATNLGVPIDVERVTVPDGGSVEAAARVVRYAALHDMLARWGGDQILTGHTQDDQAETVLLHLFRGTGLHGLGGMPVQSGQLIRPFLGVTRADVTSALEVLGQASVDDSTNVDTRYTRNRVRHEILPLLRTIQPAINSVLARTSSLLRDDASHLDAEARRAMQSVSTPSPGSVFIFSGAYRCLHPALRRAGLRLLVRDLLGDTAELEAGHVAALDSAVANERSLIARLPRELTVVATPLGVVLRHGTESRPATFHALPVSVPGTISLPHGTLAVEYLRATSDEIARIIRVAGPHHALLRAGVGHDMIVRSRRAGDRLRPVGGRGTVTLHDLFIDRGVPRALRELVPVVESGGKIVWVAGLAVAQDAAAEAASQVALHVIWTPENGRIR